jgi:hypothetical protein
LGDQVFIRKYNCRGTIINEKQGGWRCVELENGTIGRFRPSDFSGVSVFPYDDHSDLTSNDLSPPTCASMGFSATKDILTIKPSPLRLSREVRAISDITVSDDLE